MRRQREVLASAGRVARIRVARPTRHALTSCGYIQNAYFMLRNRLYKGDSDEEL